MFLIRIWQYSMTFAYNNVLNNPHMALSAKGGESHMRIERLSFSCLSGLF